MYLLLLLNHNLKSQATLLNWSATALASLYHSNCINKENMSLRSYSDLADEIKAYKIENKILKDKIKASKRPIRVIVQRHDKFTCKKIKTNAKMRFFAGIASVALFNTIFTLIKPYIYHISRTGKDQNMPCKF